VNLRPAPRTNGSNRTLGDLNDFVNTLGLVTASCDSGVATRSLGEALGADLVAVCRGDVIHDLVTWPGSAISKDELLREIEGSSAGVRRSFVDSRAFMQVPLQPVGRTLILSRPTIGFTPDEYEFAAACAVSIGSLAAARDSARRISELEDQLDGAHSRLGRLRDDLEATQGLRDRLSRIQELICQRRPIEVLLDSVSASASYLIEADAIDLHLLDSDDPSPLSGEDLVAVSAARVAMEEDRLAVVSDSSYASHAISAPIRIAGKIVGCLIAARVSHLPTIRRSRSGIDDRSRNTRFARAARLESC